MEVFEIPPYMQDYSDVIDSLPLELQRSFALLKELDDMLSKHVDDLKSSSKSYRAGATNLTAAERRSLRSEIRKLTRDSIKIAEEKVGLSRSTYDIVDRYVRKLDEDLQRLEDEQVFGGISRKSVAQSDPFQDNGLVRRKQGKVLESDLPSQAKQRPLKGTRKGRKDSNTPMPATLPSNLPIKVPLTAGPGDMPIDPNEPRYCYCHQVSFGDMVACDNDDCPLEWFHYACVGLTSPPKGSWYCKICTAKGYGRDRKR